MIVAWNGKRRYLSDKVGIIEFSDTSRRVFPVNFHSERARGCWHDVDESDKNYESAVSTEREIIEIGDK